MTKEVIKAVAVELTPSSVLRQLAQWTDKQTVHKYGQIYDSLFDDRAISSIMEIGVSAGGSIAAWSKLYPQATVYGIDASLAHARLVEEGKPDLFSMKNVQLTEHNAYDASFALALPEVDIFIDDGPHTVDSQIFAIKYYLPKVKEKGVFVIEDIQSAADAEYLMTFVPEHLKAQAFIVDISNETGRYDDRLLIVDRASIPEEVLVELVDEGEE